MTSAEVAVQEKDLAQKLGDRLHQLLWRDGEPDEKAWRRVGREVVAVIHRSFGEAGWREGWTFRKAIAGALRAPVVGAELSGD